jgi:predicted MFS family arabinose efflux permease
LANKENNANLNDPITNKNLFDIYMIYGCVFLIGLIFSQLRISYPLYLHEYYHLDSNQFGKIFLINTIIIVLFQAFILDLFAKFNYLLLTGLGSFLIGFGMFLLPFGFGLKYAIFTCLFWTLGEMLFFSTSQILAYNKASQKTKGKSLGTYQMVYASSNILGPACGGYVYHHYTGNMVWYLCGLFGLICLGLCGNSFYCRATI